MANKFTSSLFLIAFPTALGGFYTDVKAEAIDIDIDSIISSLAPNSITNITKLAETPAKCDATTNCFKFANGTDETGAPVYAYYSYEKLATTGHYEDSGRIDTPTEDIINQRFIRASGDTEYDYGGAIYNEANSSAIDTIKSDFIGNYVYSSSYASGGAVYNHTTSNIDDIIGDFVSNYVYSVSGTNAGGGAIINYYSGTLGDITGKFIGNYVYSASSQAAGGAVYNLSSSTIGDITGKFIGNYTDGKAGACAGAVYNFGSSIIGNITGDFIFNYSYSDNNVAQGGAIYAYDNATTGNIVGDFVGNYTRGFSSAHGGAIYGSTNSTFGDIAGNFIGNYTYSNSNLAYGGAIYNSNSTFGDVVGNFIDNHTQGYSSALGGAIYNSKSTFGDIAGNFVGNYTYSDSKNARGGAIYNSNATFGDIVGNFIDNHTYSDSSVAQGGAIYSVTNSTIGDITGNFVGNYTYSNSSTAYGGAILSASNSTFGNIVGNFVDNHAQGVSSALGGAIYSDQNSTFGDIVGNFVGNYASCANGAGGGAVYNGTDSTISNITGDFIDNYVQSSSLGLGGAIYNTGIISFMADAKEKDDNLQDDILFRGNYVQLDEGKQYEAIYQDEADAVLNFKSNNGGTYTFYDYINGDDIGTINFVSDDNKKAQFNLYNDIKGQANINFNNDYILNMISPEDIHENTSALSRIQAKNVTISSDIQMAVDVDLVNLEMDRFEADNFAVDTGSIIVNQINIVDDIAGEFAETKKVPFVIINTDDNGTPLGLATGLEHISTNVSKAAGDLYTYSVAFKTGTGEFEFTRAGIAPKHQESGERAAAASSNTQNSVDAMNTKLVNREVNRNLLSVRGISSGDDMIVTTWAEAFGSKNDVKLKNLPGAIDTTFYGVMGGLDSKKFMYDNGVQAIYGLYGAYVVSKQKYGQSRIDQTGEYLGASVAFRKGIVSNTFAGNVGYLHNEAKTAYGIDKFEARVVSISDKVEVDLENGSWTYTPALYVGYTGIDSDDYTTKARTKIENHFMHVFTIAPELKVTKDFGVGLDGYAKVAYKMFFYGNNKVRANGVLLPGMSAKPYIEYGIGLKKDWSQEEWSPKDITSYAELTRHDGGREGWDVNLGLKLDF